MKNSILFLSLSLMFILSSCEQSKKGAWTESDIEKCKKEILDGMKEKKEEFEMMKSMFKIDENEFSKCLCEKVEDKYESFAEADSKIDKDMNSDKGAEMVMSCMGEDFKKMMNGLEDMKNTEDMEGSEELEGAEGMEEGEPAEEKAE
jgi:hypothetical protein